MKTISISKNKYQNLEPYQLPSSIFNTEAQLYILPIKNKWQTVNKLLKKLYITSGPIFGNKLETLNSLIDFKEEIDMPEIVFPEKLAIVNLEVVGYTMDLIESINLETALRSYDVDAKTKIKYLKQIGEILEKMKLVRKFTSVQDFYLNDMHENNFVIDTKTNNIRVVDIDSCKINDNMTFASRYLSPDSIIKDIPKYKLETDCRCGGYYKPTEDTDLYCYNIMILNTLFGGGIHRISLEEFYNYLEYLYSIGAPLELIDIFEKIVSNNRNENPYELLDSLTTIMKRSNKHVFDCVRRKIK